MAALGTGAADGEARAADLAAAAISAGQPSGWFEPLYGQAARGETSVPWDRGAPHPLLGAWLEQGEVDGGGRSAIVVGCGFGSDAELLAAAGFETTAFDISPTAVAGAHERFPDSTVHFTVADLFDLPGQWHEGFDLVVEIITVQALPRAERQRAIAAVRGLLAPAGTLLLISGAMPDGADPAAGPPWPFTRAEIDSVAGPDLAVTEIERVDLGGRAYWRASFRRGWAPVTAPRRTRRAGTRRSR